MTLADDLACRPGGEDADLPLPDSLSSCVLSSASVATKAGTSGNGKLISYIFATRF